MYISLGLPDQLSNTTIQKRERTYTLMVVVKWTSAPAATLTRRSTGWLNAELRPTLPFIAADAEVIGTSDDKDDETDVDES